jgi:hypothetical protein
LREHVHDVVGTGGERAPLGEGHEAPAEDGPEHVVELPLGRPGELGQVGEGEPAPGRGDVAEDRFLELASVELLLQLVGAASSMSRANGEGSSGRGRQRRNG